MPQGFDTILLEEKMKKLIFRSFWLNTPYLKGKEL
jgi:hypothetical protein